PGVPVLALTATATPGVVEDIQDKLKFGQKNVFRKSFGRRNLAYIVMKDENKYGSILKIIQQHPGTGIIYVRNRRKTREVADYLRKNKISADFYHAGLEPAERERKQDNWIHEKTSIMVSTNAFGMGIDKPNVRFVIHIDLPDSPEAYFQEAGRAGRDEQESIAVLLYDESDVLKAQKNFENSYPGLEVIKSVYQAIGNYYQLATGSGKDLSLDFDINEFSETFRISPVITYNSLRFLEKEGYLALNEIFNVPARLFVTISHDDLYRFQVENPRIDPFIKLILRLYSGLFSDYVNINENDIAKKAGIPLETVVKTLKMLDKMEIFSYLPARSKPQLIFLKERADIKNVFISPANYSERKAEAAKRLESVINYVTGYGRCRSQSLLSYFGEKDSTRCGKCDVCLKWNSLDLNDIEFEQISGEIKKSILNKPLTLQEILFIMGRFNEEKTIEVIRWLEESGQIIKKPDQRYTWKRQFKLFS
ncbi:MAG: RecQ family zinc-binding domain-containing protein, partial [Bacteroidetes bacterium]|nr:RecQ family zinc-binding domain-containing protein [Bacteroidota bacterium]